MIDMIWTPADRFTHFFFFSDRNGEMKLIWFLGFLNCCFVSIYVYQFCPKKKFSGPLQFSGPIGPFTKCLMVCLDDLNLDLDLDLRGPKSKSFVWIT